MSNTKFSTVGWVARSKDSVQPVHSCAPIHNTGGRLGSVKAAVISAPAFELNPIVAASAVHNFIKSRRETSAKAENNPSLRCI